MTLSIKKPGLLVMLLLIALLANIKSVSGHGNVTPQSVDTGDLESLGDEWRLVNPYRGNVDAVEIGKSAYSGNCARCHGLGAVSGGIAPDLRLLGTDAESDEWYITRAKNGSVRNGMTYMPAMGDFISQEALWAIGAWLDTIRIEE